MLITWRSRSSFIELCDVIIAAYVVAHHNLNTSPVAKPAGWTVHGDVGGGVRRLTLRAVLGARTSPACFTGCKIGPNPNHNLAITREPADGK